MRVTAVIAQRLRSAARPLLGRPGVAWSLVRSPALRLRAFRDRIDCVLYGLSISRPDVFFVQIGSNDAGAGDPLRAFLDRGHWRGIMVEAVPYVFRRLESKRGRTPRLILENAAIADRCGTCEFHYIEDSPHLPTGYDQLGSLDPQLLRRLAANVPGAAERLTSTRVNCLTLQALCDKHEIDDIDLIHIDAEGYDYEVLRQIDLARYRPAVVLYEHTWLAEPDRQAAREMLHANGYDALEVGQDTLAVSRGAREAYRALGEAWKLASPGSLKRIRPR